MVTLQEVAIHALTGLRLLLEEAYRGRVGYLDRADN